MDNEEFEKVSAGLRASIQRFPNCKVASCECDEREGEWKVDCNCPGHWFMMDKEFGEGNWNFEDAAASQDVGKPVRADEDHATRPTADVDERMKCPQCGRQLTGVEYAYNDPDHYDGVSEWACFPCGYHRGRWSGKILEEGEKEPRYGRK